jgi:hypothetical protein
MRVRDFRADRSFFHLTSAAHPPATTQKNNAVTHNIYKKRKIPKNSGFCIFRRNKKCLKNSSLIALS